MRDPDTAASRAALTPGETMTEQTDTRTYRIVRAVRTCFVCPAQWDAWTDQGDYLYIRCRHDRLTVDLFPDGADWKWDSPRTLVASVDADVMDLAEVCRLTGLELAEDAKVEDAWLDYARTKVDAEQQDATQV
ncbi:hypothetical protein [Nocardia farcinica]|uniref:hypothetical protein n=1 Tax=Nocardia farcinica TaxID=37329 RepID=UPI00245489E8|nr:hypothetical protein [Nocardia farcinica]